MLKDIVKDFFYYLRIMGEQFRSLMTLKVNALPIVLPAISSLFLKIFKVSIPDWVLLSISIITPIFWVLLVILHRARKLEDPELKVLFDENDGCRQASTISNAIGPNATIFFRLKIMNMGSTVLTNCSAELVGIKRKDEAGKYISLNYGERTPLVWSNTDDQARKIPLQPKVSKFLDVLRLKHSIVTNYSAIGLAEYAAGEVDEACLITKDYAPPNSVAEHHNFNILGEYILIVRFSADQILAFEKEIHFVWNGNMQDAVMSLV